MKLCLYCKQPTGKRIAGRWVDSEFKNYCNYLCTKEYINVKNVVKTIMRKRDRVEAELAMYNRELEVYYKEFPTLRPTTHGENK